MWSSLPDKLGSIDTLLYAYGDTFDRRLLGPAVVAFWFRNYWRGRDDLQLEPLSQPSMERQPGRLRSALGFANEWDARR